MLRKIALLALGISCLPSLQAEAPAGDSYTVGLAVLEDAGVSIEARPFLAAFPKLVILAATPLPPRLPGEAYRLEETGRKALVDAFKQGDELADKLDRSAAVLFSPGLTKEERRTRSKSAEAGLGKLLSSMTDTQKASVDVSREAPAPLRTEFYKNGTALIPDTSTHPMNLALKERIDLVVMGRATSTGAYISISVSAYESRLGREAFTWKGYADPADPWPLAQELADALRTWIAGGPYGSISLRPNPPQSLVHIEGAAFLEKGRTLFSFSPEELQISAWAPGHQLVRRSALIQPGEHKGLVLNLESVDYGTASLKSRTEELALFLDGDFLGSAPSTAKLLGTRSILVAEAAGYETARAVLPAQGAVSIEIEPRPDDGLGPQGRVTKARDRFYASLGRFVLALPFTSLSIGLLSLYNEAYQRNPQPTLSLYRTIAGLATAASIITSGGLAIGTASRLGDYIESAAEE